MFEWKVDTEKNYKAIFKYNADTYEFKCVKEGKGWVIYCLYNNILSKLPDYKKTPFEAMRYVSETIYEVVDKDMGMDEIRERFIIEKE